MSVKIVETGGVSLTRQIYLDASFHNVPSANVTSQELLTIGVEMPTILNVNFVLKRGLMLPMRVKQVTI